MCTNDDRWVIWIARPLHWFNIRLFHCRPTVRCLYSKFICMIERSAAIGLTQNLLTNKIGYTWVFLLEKGGLLADKTWLDK